MSANLDQVVSALGTSRVFDLAQPFFVGMPQSPNHPPYQQALVRRHGDVVRSDGGSAANDIIVTGTHVGTHIDALCHVSQDGMLHCEVDAAAAQSNTGFATYGVDTIEPFVGRCVVLDIAALRGVAMLAPGEAVTAADLDAAEGRFGVTVQPGDALLIATGWSRCWDDRATYMGQQGGAPGPDASAGDWIVRRQVRLAGAETIAFEQIKPGSGHATLPVHRKLLVEAGINIIEGLRLSELVEAGVHECVLIVSPLKFQGATGSPVRPLAVVPRETAPK
jgi:kynurenine formamidase